MTKDVEEAQRGYIEALAGRFEALALEDRDGDPITGFNPSEVEGLVRFLTDFALRGAGGKAYRGLLEIGQNANKELLVLIGLWPLIAADAQSRGIPLLIVAPNAEGAAGWKNRLRDYRILTNLPAQVLDWSDFPSYREQVSGPCWVVGDLDSDGQPLVSRSSDYRRAGGDPVEWATKALHEAIGSGPVLLLHRKGETAFCSIPDARNRIEQPMREGGGGAGGFPCCVLLLAGTMLASAVCLVLTRLLS